MATPTAAWPRISFDYRGVQVLVTGGTSGIGAAVAAAYLHAGASVTITGTRANARAYDEDLGAYRYLQLDVTDKAGIARVAAELPALDILVHSGGIALASIGIDESEPDHFATAIEMHLTGIYRLSHACLPLLKASKLEGGASVIGIASMSSYFGIEIVPGYGAAKAGLVQLMKTFAVSWARYGIRANAVAAGLVVSRQTGGLAGNPDTVAHLLQRVPLQRLGQPEDIAAGVLFLTSPASSWTTGQTLPICGGFSIAG
ncbi:MAG: short-chain dehydrogenase/reductase [Hydrocarboniphaga sp.]|uniref:SDR family NAD(P)-dependent oxidoreductase n=1 Tax=Hydrocarboniphaga sp. TaxID=2033016 RepID=UPI0026029485|nr:SDR family oxidoreductase [Hydrocarboniphaga sp.]MDB5970643.1 short-chain dehydrogenase/reductase [Hydrocarboniphaga sp.]